MCEPWGSGFNKLKRLSETQGNMELESTTLYILIGQLKQIPSKGVEKYTTRHCHATS